MGTDFVLWVLAFTTAIGFILEGTDFILLVLTLDCMCTDFILWVLSLYYGTDFVLWVRRS